ncbi:hypothetical protein CC80DRAFT_518813 [Byssothecium circinans]|uniref:Uncharacterized protein n=1 Tax=Byssothecium circinans TaxID=147558 RepID=A0A6A5TKT3_9PLEO|nr:hypothetical protein CC80DRAFT_518813 [Byssothecium circinans]
MSYADAAAKGPKQSAEEVTNTAHSRAPALPQVERSDDSVSSLIDVDSPHVSSVPSDFESQAVKTDTQATRINAEAEARNVRVKAQEAADKAKAKTKRGGNYAKVNSDNPVFIVNALTVGVLGTALGVGAYRKFVRDELTWKVVGAWAGVVGLFGVADYYVSEYFFQKYPPKK